MHPHQRRVRVTPARRWQPLADAEWNALLPFALVREGPGRPLEDARKRMDAIFRTAASGSAWRAVPPRFGKADTVSRHFRRLCRAGLWERPLRALARPDAPPAPLATERWIVSACRRAARLRGAGIVAVTRRLGFLSALRAPSHLPPKPDLPGIVEGRPRRGVDHARERGPDAAAFGFLRFCHRLGAFAAGRRRIPRRFQPI